MKKLFATFLLLMCFSMAFAGKAGTSDNVVFNPKSQCHDSEGKWDPQNKNCDPNSCGCLFHQIEDFLKGMFG